MVSSTLGLPVATNAESPASLHSHGSLPWGWVCTPPPELSQGVEAGYSRFIHLHRDPLGGGSHASPRRVVRCPQTRPSRCLLGPRRPRPCLPGPSGCGTRVRGWRTLHCGPRAAHSSSGADVLGPSAGSRRRGRSSRLWRRRRRRRRNSGHRVCNSNRAMAGAGQRCGQAAAAEGARAASGEPGASQF